MTNQPDKVVDPVSTEPSVTEFQTLLTTTQEMYKLAKEAVESGSKMACKIACTDIINKFDQAGYDEV